MERVSSSVATQWLSFRNRNLSQNMPWWFRNGLSQHMKFARVKGKTVKIKPDEIDRDWIKTEIKQNKVIPVKQLFEKGDENQRSMWGMQAGSVVTYLLGPGNRGKKTKNIVQNYMRNLITAIEEAEAEFDKKTKKIADEAKKEADDYKASSRVAIERETEAAKSAVQLAVRDTVLTMRADVAARFQTQNLHS